MFFKRKESIGDFNHLIKIYFTFKVGSIKDHLQSILERYQQITGVTIAEFSVNYKNDCKIEKLKSMKIDIDHLDSILFFSSDDFGFDLSKIPCTPNTGVYEFRFLFPRKSFDDEELILSLVNFFMDHFEIVYGYYRLLPKNFSRVSESEVKKSLFGNVFVESFRFDESWFSPPEHMLTTGIKGLYLYNFVNHDVLELPVIKKIIGYPKVVVDSLNEKISCIKIPVETLPSLRKENRDIKDYIRD